MFLDKIITDARFSSKLLINLDNSSSASSPTLSRRENSIDKTNYFNSNNNNNNNNNSSYISGSSIVPIINSKQQQHIRETDNKQRESSNSTFSNNHVSYESKINHFVDSYSHETTNITNTAKHTQPNHVSESKFTLINYHQPQPTKFSNSSSALSYLNEIEIPARLKRSSSFRSNSKKQQHQQQQQQQQHLIAQKASPVDIQSRDQVKQTTPMTDSGFMSSFNSLSSSNSSSPPLLLSASKPMSNSPSSSSSSSPTSLSKVISNDNDHQSNRANPTNVKTIAKTYELNATNGNNSNNNTSSNILPSYFKPKLNSANEKPNSIIKIINNNTENSRLIRTKFDSFEMPDAQTVSSAGVACVGVGQTKKEEKEISKQPEITSLNVNEIILDSSSSHVLSSKQAKTNDANNETSHQSSSSSASSCLTKQKLVKLNLNKSFDNDLEIKKSPSQNNPSSFHKVLNKIVETGISSFTPSTTFSKPPIASSSSSFSSSSSSKKQTYNNFEPINGYEDKTVGNEPAGPVVGDSKLKKKHSYSYKSSSLTRQGKQSDENKKNLFKLNEFESINISKLSTEQPQLKQSSPSQTVPAKKQEKTYNFFSNFNSSNVSKDANSTSKSKGYNISSSLPSRNLGNKVVDDIKSLFDKFTNPSSGKNAQNKLAKNAENDENLVQNDSISSSSCSQQTSHEAARLSTFKSENASRLKQSKSFSVNHSKLETDLSTNGKASFGKFDYECPDSPR